MEEESKSLELLLGNNVTAFFETVWQQACAVYPCAVPKLPNQTDIPWKKERAHGNPFRALIESGWDVLVDLMEQKLSASVESNPTRYDALLFRDCGMLSKEERSLYENFWAAYIDGCSVVFNHADLCSPAIAALCEDLQKSVPHCFANVYITPPRSQTVHAHADDRDVLVMQVYGSKAWRVYQRVPIPYPYPNEQVGKDGCPVPTQVLEGPVLIERTLRPGDVLYMPRGYVHEAVSNDDCSFHVTVALATHDWTLLGVLSAASSEIWSRNLSLRRAMPREFGRGDISVHREALQNEIDCALAAVRNEVTPEAVDAALRNKYNSHNERAATIRQRLIQTPNSNESSMDIVGPRAAKSVTLSTMLRAATDSEKASVRETEDARGLMVQEAIHDAVLSIVQELKRQPMALNDVTRPSSICNLTLVAVAKQCVSLGALAVER